MGMEWKLMDQTLLKWENNWVTERKARKGIKRIKQEKNAHKIRACAKQELVKLVILAALFSEVLIEIFISA